MFPKPDWSFIPMMKTTAKPPVEKHYDFSFISVNNFDSILLLSSNLCFILVIKFLPNIVDVERLPTDLQNQFTGNISKT